MAGKNYRGRIPSRARRIGAMRPELNIKKNNLEYKELTKAA
jgi:hypothetical protein